MSGLATGHEIGDGHEYVEHTGVLGLASQYAKLLVHFKRAFANKIAWNHDAKPHQVGGTCPTDVRQISEGFNPLTDHLVRMHVARLSPTIGAEYPSRIPFKRRSRKRVVYVAFQALPLSRLPQLHISDTGF